MVFRVSVGMFLVYGYHFKPVLHDCNEYTLFFLSPFDLLKTAGRTPSAMGCKARKVLLLFLACTMAQMFLVLTHCTLQEVELFSASGTRFQFATCFRFVILNIPYPKVKEIKDNLP
jgi:hypothetical protein